MSRNRSVAESRREIGAPDLRASVAHASPRRRLGGRLGAAILAGGVLAGSGFAVSSVPVAFGVNVGISKPAELSDGLQSAVRLDPKPPPPTNPGSTVGSGLPADVEELLDLVNAERQRRGIVPLLFHGQLAEAGAAHAADYFNLNCLTSLSHTGRDGSDPGDRIRRTGLQVSTWGENLACNNQSPTSVNQAWMNSSGHRANILNPNFTHIGISITRDAFGHPYWVQVFGTPR